MIAAIWRAVRGKKAKIPSDTPQETPAQPNPPPYNPAVVSNGGYGDTPSTITVEGVPNDRDDELDELMAKFTQAVAASVRAHRVRESTLRVLATVAAEKEVKRSQQDPGLASRRKDDQARLSAYKEKQTETIKLAQQAIEHEESLRNAGGPMRKAY